MENLKNIQYSLDEVCLLPSSFPSEISSRSQVNPFRDGYLPIFTAPMTSIIDRNNAELFSQNKIIPILPRTTEQEFKVFLSTLNWVAFSLEEFKTLFVNNCQVLTDNELEVYHVLIDVANGHMKEIYDSVKAAKKTHQNHIKIMIGNIAHPEMFKYAFDAEVDYIRVGIGGGSVCTSSVLTGLHASHLWLIENIKKYKEYYIENRPKLIADGGINRIDKAIKCLGIGYDYVMMGKCFASCKEACGTIEGGFRTYYGMASELGQKALSGKVTKNPEGTEYKIYVDTTLKDFSNKFEASLRSAMSYTGSLTLDEFQESEYGIQSINEFNSYYK